MDTPKLTAHFVLDPSSGKPQAIEDGDLKHYEIRLQVNDAPKDTYAVTYVLHDSYRKPIRESVDKENDFEEKVTSFGDYTIQAKVRTKQGVFTIATPLSDALSAGHRDTNSQVVKAALSDLSSR